MFHLQYKRFLVWNNPICQLWLLFSMLFWVLFKRSLFMSMLWSVSPFLSSIFSIVSGLTFRFLIYIWESKHKWPDPKNVPLKWVGSLWCENTASMSHHGVPRQWNKGQLGTCYFPLPLEVSWNQYIRPHSSVNKL